MLHRGLRQPPTLSGITKHKERQSKKGKRALEAVGKHLSRAAVRGNGSEEGAVIVVAVGLGA